MRKSGETRNKVYAFIAHYIEANSIPPTVREICAALDIRSTSTVHMHITKLANDGLISINPSKQRSITLPKKDTADKSNTEMRTVPLLGNVAAGLPILAVENIREYYSVPQKLLRGAGSDEVFMLEVHGQSMINVGINDGDTIVVHNGIAVEQGDIAVVRVEGESATLKRIFYEKDNKIRLQPENSTMQPLIYNRADVEIIGRLIGLYRKY